MHMQMSMCASTCGLEGQAKLAGAIAIEEIVLTKKICYNCIVTVAVAESADLIDNMATGKVSTQCHIFIHKIPTLILPCFE